MHRLFFDASVTGGQPWEPKNYDGTFEGPMSLRKGLAKSKNMMSIRVLQAVGAQNAQDWIAQFGFDAEKHPPYLTMALGRWFGHAHANGHGLFGVCQWRLSRQPLPHHQGDRPNGQGACLSSPAHLEESTRAIDARNAFVMTSLLQEVTRSGTAARAQATFKRNDIYGKTGTTNDSMDAWFAGYHPTSRPSLGLVTTHHANWVTAKRAAA